MTRYNMRTHPLILFFAVWLSNLPVISQELQKGKASYYANRLHGRTMSNGEKYHKDSMTCAHLKYPLGTMLRVRNPLNGKEVIVKVTDRGPYVKKYIIDLSRAAAKELDMLRAGFMQVEISVYKPGEPPFRLEDNEEIIPELDLDYQLVATYPTPLWQPADTIPTQPTSKKNSGKQ